MKGNIKRRSMQGLLLVSMLGVLLMLTCGRDDRVSAQLRNDFLDPPEEAKPWVFWYWMNAAVSREAITADLEAMQRAGIGGAYLMPIRGADDPPLFDPPAVQLSPYWWELVMHALKEADRLGLKIGMHASDGFALAGGPWITPELSMQKIVWTETFLQGGRDQDILLAQPETNEGYYRDIAVFAYPSVEGSGIDSEGMVPHVSSSIPGVHPDFLAHPDNREIFRSQDSCWILYAFEEPFPCRNITIRTREYNYPAHRLWVQTSNNGKDFTTLCRLEPPRHGWQEESEEVVHAVPPVRARYFRFLYGKTGLEPGAEDLEMAKWSPYLRIRGIHLSGTPRIHQYKGKTASIWRIAPASTEARIPDSLCVPLKDIKELTGKMDSSGLLNWEVPPGKWTILRMGHTSTGKTNYTGGGGLGLECDKFNPRAAAIQFENWFGAVIRKAGPERVERVLKIFHVDSWECGSQNWSPVFRDEFIRRRGYDPLQYLPAMAGIPLQSARETEKYLHDIRKTVSELLIDNFYRVLVDSARSYGCSFSAECTAPTMTGDGMLHYDAVDLPMGEFWLRSPTHDKPNDMLDAISGAHVYGKRIVQAEAFTERRMNWEEHPAMVKALGDRNLALGANRLFIHVYTHNPWMDRKPGMTLSRIGLFFQRDQVWWEQGRAWVEYLRRCQAMLQKGSPVADIAVFTGEEIPRRAVLPDRLVPVMPGLFGTERVESERKRLANRGVPQREMPAGVLHSANMADPGDWTDPLRGYAYDCFNPDVLMNLASVKNGRIVLPCGISYRLLILPGARRMDPQGNLISEELAAKIRELAGQGATVLLGDFIRTASGQPLFEAPEEAASGPGKDERIFPFGKGMIVIGPWEESSFHRLGIEPDLLALETSGERAGGIAWAHRRLENSDIYFVSNQLGQARDLVLSFRSTGRWPDLYDPLSGEIVAAGSWQESDGRTSLPLKIHPHGSLFVVFERNTGQTGVHTQANLPEPDHYADLEGPWEIRFDPGAGGPESVLRLKELKSWHLSEDPRIRHYSGTAVYSHTFNWSGRETDAERFWLGIEELYNLAEVYLNGTYCGIIWTHPCRVEISDHLVNGENQLEIRVSNTWANRMIGDRDLPGDQRFSWTTLPFDMRDRSLLRAGICGKVSIYKR